MRVSKQLAVLIDVLAEKGIVSFDELVERAEVRSEQYFKGRVYQAGDRVRLDGHEWESTVDNNVWAPGVSGWHRLADPGEAYPQWVAPTGAHDSYGEGDRVTHNGESWESMVSDNVWEPGEFGWVVV